LLFCKSANLQVIEYTARLSSKLHLLFYRHWARLYDAETIRNRHEYLLTTIRTADAAAVEAAFRRHYADTGIKVAKLYQPPADEAQHDH
jgi:DNA-binding GntR family transcriptional regulator